jgi:D-xylose transport system substrate-binding protein
MLNINLRRWSILAIAILLIAVLAACGDSAEEATEVPEEPTAETEATTEEEATEEPAMEEEGSIWVLLPDSASSDRWETDDRRFFEAAFEAAGVEYNIVNAEGDARTQQTQAEQAITAGAKVILLVNLDSGSAAAIIAQARDAGVAVVDYDRLTVEGPGADVYVSFDNVQVGATMGEVLEPLISAQDGTPQVVLLNGGPTDNNSTLFREGYVGYAQPHFDDGSWELVDDQWVPDWDNQQALVIFEQILTAAENNVTGVFAANDGLANAVISAFQSAGIDPGEAGIPISGQDATVGGMQHVLAGDQAMSVYKPIKAEAEAAAAAGIALLRGESLDSLTGGLTLNNGTNDIPFVALTPIGVTKDNVGETVIADGFRTWEEICVGEFEQYCPGEEEAMAEEEEVVEEEMGPDLSGETISFWHVFRSGGQAEGMTEIVAEFNDTNEWGITVEDFEQGGQGDLEEAVNAAIVSGDLPNVTLGFANAMSNWYSVGVIAPINEFIEDAQYGLSADELGALYEGPYHQGTLPDGTQIGIPMHQSAQVLFYNNSWAEELGFDAPPATSAEFKEQACAAAEANANDDDPDNDGTGGLVHFPGASNIAAWVYAFGGDIVNEAGDAYTLNSPVVKEVALFLKDLQDSGCTFATDSFPNPEMATRKALFTTSSTAGIPFQAAAFEEVGSSDEWSLIPFPGPDGNLAINAFGQLIGIVDTNETQNLASWLWIRYLTSPETQAKWINWTGYYPSQTTTVPLIADYAAENPLWSFGQELAPLGKSEPNMAAHGSVRGAIQDAFFAVGDAADEAAIDAILEELQATAEELVAESQ